MKELTKRWNLRALRTPGARAIMALALAGVFTTACERKAPTGLDPTLATITVSPNPRTLSVNGTQQFEAVAKDNLGATITITPVWEVVTGGGTISSTGLFTAGTLTGTFANTVRATSGGKSGTATVIVTGGPLATIAVTPNPATLGVGATQQFAATGRDAFGNIVQITPLWAAVAGGGPLNENGLFTAGNVTGTFANTIRASSGGISGTATVNITAGAVATIVVTPNPATLATGATQQFTAVARDAGGNVVAISPAWSVVNGGGAINAGSGVFTAGGAAGTFTNTVQASAGGMTGTATVIVTQPASALATITVSPNPASVPTNSAQPFTAVGRDGNGNVIAITPVWTVVNGGGVINAGTGVFTAGGVIGTFGNTVMATSGSISGTATVNVIAPSSALASITVSPNPATVPTRAGQPFSAVGRDGNGNIVPITPVWTVVNGGGVINSSTGMFTAGDLTGPFINTVRATSGGISGTATVNVIDPPPSLASITVTPDPASLVVGGTQQFTAVGRDSNGDIMPIVAVWTVDNGGGSINSNTGLFTAGAVTGTFDNTVKATSGNISGNATVIVSAVPQVLATITVTPNPGTVVTGANRQFTAVGRDTNGNIMGITPVWSVINGGGTINATGRFTAGNVVGTFSNTVRAASGAISGTATVNVTDVPSTLTTITVTPNPTSVATNAQRQFTAVGRDQNGDIMPIVPVWSVINGGGIINSNSGRFTAGNVAGTFNNTVRAASGAISGTATVTVTAVPPPPIVNLGAAAPNGIMAGTAVTCVTGGIINADVSISPGNTITGFGPCVITGVQHLNDAVAAQAQIDLATAYNTLMGLPCPPANAIVANLGGTTKEAGVYCTASGIGVTGTLTLDGGGDPNATFVFQAGSSLTTAGDIVLINGAQAKNVYWVVGSSATIGTASKWQGNIIALTSITLVDNATLKGRALARNGAVSLGTNNVIILP